MRGCLVQLFAVCLSERCLSSLRWVGTSLVVSLCFLLLACSGDKKVAPPQNSNNANKAPSVPFSCEETPLPKTLSLSIALEPDTPGIGPHRLVVLAKHTITNLFVELKDLKVVPWMTEHNHGAPVEPQVTRVYKGKYVVEPVHFSMAGSWELKLSMTWDTTTLVRCLSYKAGSFSVKGPNQPSDKILSDVTPPVLERLIVSLDGDYQPKTKQMGRLLCDLDVKQHGACLSPFASGQTDQNPTGGITFLVSSKTPVYAASSGVVTSVTFMEHSHITHSDLYSVATQINSDGAFFVEYQRVKNLQVKVGDAVRPGQRLGDAGDYHDIQHGKVSLLVRRLQENHQRLCPQLYFASGLEQQMSLALQRLTNAGLWPKDAPLCQVTSFLCHNKTCNSPSSFVELHGDLDAGRRMYRGGCQSCHGGKGEGGIGTDLCLGKNCVCISCKQGHQRLSERIALDMPPEGSCQGSCARDVAAYILHAFTHDN